MRDRGVRTVLLDQYVGTPTPGAKVGTYSRSKGLEFVRVFLPDVAEGKFPTVPLDQTDEYLLQASRLYVAMARARDQLFISYVGAPSYLVEQITSPDPSLPVVSTDEDEPWVELTPDARRAKERGELEPPPITPSPRPRIRRTSSDYVEPDWRNDTK